MVPRALIDWGVATLALPGEAESGDLSTVQTTERGVLIGAVDGLGHGAEAAAAARRAVAVLERCPGDPMLQLVQACHQALVGTRGVVMSLAFFDRIDRSLTWLGVGNVEGVLLYADRAARPARTTLIAPGGIVGSELPRVQAQVISVTPGDTLIFASDGIKSGFADDPPLDAAPQQLAERILARYGRGTDDALVVVARYLGDGGGGA